jgi:restriction system protein
MTATIADVPTFDAFMAPLVQRLRARGGSMTIAEIEEDVPAAMGLSEDVRAVIYGKWQENAVEARLGWARS